MRKLLLLLALPLAGCATLTGTGTSECLQKENAYKAFRLSAETAVDKGLVKGVGAESLAVLDNAMYANLCKRGS